MAVAATPPDESGRAQAIDGTFMLIDADCRPIFHNFVLRILLASTSANGSDSALLVNAHRDPGKRVRSINPTPPDVEQCYSGNPARRKAAE